MQTTETAQSSAFNRSENEMIHVANCDDSVYFRQLPKLSFSACCARVRRTSLFTFACLLFTRRRRYRWQPTACVLFRDRFNERISREFTPKIEFTTNSSEIVSKFLSLKCNVVEWHGIVSDAQSLMR